MELRNRQVSPADRVYDVALGWGKVRQIEVHTSYPIVVVFANGRTQAYSPEGHTARFLQPTLFWDNPVVSIPSSGMDASLFRRMVSEMAARIDNPLG